MTLELDRFRGIPLFRGLPDSELTPLLALFQPVTAATGSTLFSAGDPATQIYLLLAGTVSLEQEGEHLYKLRAPTLIGELGGIAGLRRKCRAIVGEGAELVAVAPAALERLLAEHPVLGLRFQHELLEIAADKIQRDQLRLEEMRKNLVRTQKEMKKLRDYVLESDDTVVSAAVHDCLEGLIRQNRRVNYRVEPPPALAATVTGDDGVRGAVREISRTHLAFERASGELPAPGTLLSAVLTLPGGELPVSGKVLRTRERRVDVELDLLFDDYAGLLETYLTQVQMLDFLV